MKLNYIDIIKQAARSTWKTKAMWFLGIFISSGTSCQVSNLNNSNSWETGTWSKEFTNFGNWIEQYWWILIMLIIMLATLALIMLIMNNLAISGMYYGAKQTRLNKKVGFIEMIKVGLEYFWKIIGLNLLVGISVTFAFFGVILSFSLMAISIVGLLLAAPGFILFMIGSVPFIIAMGLVMIFAIQYIVFEKQGIIEALKSGWLLLYNNIADSILMYLIVMLCGFGFVLVTLLITIIIALPFVLAGLATYFGTENITITVIVGLIGGFALLIVWAFMKGVFNTFIYHTWHQVFAQLTGQK